MPDELIATIDCGPRKVRRNLNTGEVIITGGPIPLAGEVAKEKLESLVLARRLSEEDIAKILSVFRPYEVGKFYDADALFQFENKLYRVIQAHTSQADWRPDKATSLYTTAVPQSALPVIPVWVQPTGAHDAYAKDAQVEWPGGSGTVWISLIDANVWEPGAIGTTGLWMRNKGRKQPK